MWKLTRRTCACLLYGTWGITHFSNPCLLGNLFKVQKVKCLSICTSASPAYVLKRFLFKIYAQKSSRASAQERQYESVQGPLPDLWNFEISDWKYWALIWLTQETNFISLSFVHPFELHCIVFFNITSQAWKRIREGIGP